MNQPNERNHTEEPITIKKLNDIEWIYDMEEKQGKPVTLTVIATTDAQYVWDARDITEKGATRHLIAPNQDELGDVLAEDHTKEVWITNNQLNSHVLRNLSLIHEKCITVLVDVPQRENGKLLNIHEVRRYVGAFEADAGVVVGATDCGINRVKNRFGSVGLIEKEELFA